MRKDDVFSVLAVGLGVLLSLIVVQFLVAWGFIHAATELGQLAGLYAWEPTAGVTAAGTGFFLLVRSLVAGMIFK